MHNATLFTIIVFLIAGLTACETSRLDKPFDIKRYDYDTKKLLGEKAVDKGEFFLINYAIQRQRDYFNYEVEGKNFGEILAMAEQFKAEGLPVTQFFNPNGDTQTLMATVEFDGVGTVRKKANSKILLKTLNFNCSYENNSDKNLVLENSTFQFFGPLQDYLTSASYELNCLIKAKESISVNFFLDAKHLKDNALFGCKYDLKTVWIDSLIENTEVLLAGSSLEYQTATYEPCLHGGNRIKPINIHGYEEKFKGTDWQEKDNTGKITKLNFGDAHIMLEKEDKIIEYK